MDDDLLRSVWSDLRQWLDGDAIAPALERRSVLDAWTVRELIAHIGRSFTTLTGLQPTDEPPLGLLDYVAAYRPVAKGIATATRDQAAAISGDVVVALDELVTTGLDALATTDAEVVRGPRGPIRRSDFVVTRMLEVVVHGDDLQRSVPEAGAIAWDRQGVERLATALADGYEVRTGRRPTMADPLDWIREAAGRVPSADPALPLL